MRILIGIVVVASLAWGGYWFLGARGIEAALTDWVETRRDEGWVAEASAIDTAGFPNRFDTTLSDLELADPDTGLAWSFPQVQILTLSYTPNHIILALPRAFIVASPQQRIEVANARMRGSVVFVPGTALTLDRSSFEMAEVTVSSTNGWRGQIAQGQFATRRSPTASNGQDVFFEATDIVPAQAVLSFLDPANLLPARWDGMKLDVTLGFDAPWDRFSIEDRRPQPTSLTVKTARADWGDVTLELGGELKIDAGGWPTGEINIRARNWRAMLRIARDTGVMPANLEPTITRALEVLANLSGNAKTLDAPLTFRNKRVFFAGLPIGPAPNLALR